MRAVEAGFRLPGVILTVNDNSINLTHGRTGTLAYIVESIPKSIMVGIKDATNDHFDNLINKYN